MIIVSADGNYHITTMTKATLFANGLVKWEPPAIFKVRIIICREREGNNRDNLHLFSPRVILMFATSLSMNKLVGSNLAPGLLTVFR